MKCVKSDDRGVLRCAAACCLAIALASSWNEKLSADDAPPAVTPIAELQRAESVSFAKDILPVLRQNCLACHNASKAESELALDTVAAMLKGGAGGSVVVPEKSGESRLLAIAAGSEEPLMPPAENKVGAARLTSEQLGLLKRWIDEGAKSDADGSAPPIAWQPLPPGVQPVLASALSPDGQFAVCSRANQIFIYHLPTAALVTRLTDPALMTGGVYTQPGVAHLDLVQSLAFSPDGFTLASAGFREVKLWQRPRARLAGEIAAAVAQPTAVTASADGNLLAIAGQDRAIRIVRRSDGQTLATLAGHEGRVAALRFAPDGSLLVSTGADRTVRSWNVSGGVLVGQLGLGFEPTALTLMDGPVAVVGGAGGELVSLPLPSRMPMSLARSGQAITAAASSPGGKLALARQDLRVELREIATGKLLNLSEEISAPARALAFTPDEARLVAGGVDGRVTLINAGDGARLDTWDAGSAVTSLAVMGDGSQVFVGGADGNVSVWRPVVDTAPVQPPRLEARGRVWTLSPSGKMLASDGLLDGKPAVVLRDAADGHLIRHLGGAAAGVAALAFSLDDSQLAAAAIDGSVTVWNTADGALVHTIAGRGVPVTAIAPADAPGQMIVGSDDGRLQIVNLADGAVVRDLPGHTRSILAVRRAPTGQVWSLSADQTLRRWQQTDGALLATANVSGAPASLAVSTNGGRIVVGTQSRTAEVFSPTGERQGTITLFDAPVRWLALSADGGQLFAAGGAGHVAVADLTTQTVIERLPLSGPASFLFAAADPNAVLVGGPDQAWQVRQRRFVRRLAPLGSEVRGLALSKNGAILVSASAAGQVRSEQIQSGGAALVATLEAPTTAIGISSDGLRAAVGDERGRVTLLDTTTMTPLGSLPTPTWSAIARVTYSADGKSLAVGASDGRVAVFDAVSGLATLGSVGHTGSVTHLVLSDDAIWSAAADGVAQSWPLVAARTFPSHGAAISALERSGDGALLLSASRDGVVRAAEFASGQEKHRLELGAPVTALAIRNDGAVAAAVTESGAGRIWKLADGAIAAELKGDPATTREHDRWTALTTVAQAKTKEAKDALDATDKELVARTEAVPKAELARTTAIGEAEPAKLAATVAAEALAAADKAAVDAAATLAAAVNVQTEAGKALEAATAVAKLAADAQAAAKKSQEILAMAHEATVAAVNTAVAAQASKPDDGALAAAKTAAEQTQTQAATALTAAQGAAASSEQILALRNATVTEATAKKTAADQAHAAAAAASGAAAEAKSVAEKKSTEAAAAAKAAADKLAAAEAALLDAQRSLQLAHDARALAQAKHAAAAAIDQQNAAHREQAAAAATAAKSPWRSATFAPDSRTLIVAADNGRLHHFDSASGAAMETVAIPAGAAWLGTLPEGREQTLHADGVLRTWQSGGEWTLSGRIGAAGADPQSVAASGLIDRVLTLAFSPDGRLLATGGGEPSRSGELKVWNVADGSLRLDLPEAHSDTVFGVDFSSDGRYLASAAADKFVKVFDATTGAPLRSLEGHTHHVLGVGWRFDGTLLASSGADKVIKIWNFDSGEQQRTIQGFNKEATSVRFVGATGLTLTSSGDTTLRLHNADDGKSPRSFGGAGEFLHTAAVTPDGKLVVAGGQDGVLRVWNGEDGKSLMSFNPPDAAAANQQAAK